MNASGRTALVTGGARRLGKAIAIALAHRGARVAVHYRQSREDALRTVAELRASGAEACAVHADQTKEDEVRRAVDEAAAALGPIDILVNNAAVFERTPFPEAGVDSWDRHMAVNLRGPYLFARAVAPSMRERGAGKIVNMVDVAAEEH
ncbi:MAG: SDR family NAD(P)-dependent oxidoreductase, partial [Candidatus Sumerlaeota bacterium]|nr:SDR family NAD(P)-dependent oxidoreductase [Candidatus Sumerlaeota bacterium]